MLILLICLVSSLALLAKGKQRHESEKKETHAGEFTFRVPVDVVVVNASARDEKGQPVADLRKEDFRVYEDGQMQPIHTFSLESYNSQATAGGVPGETPPDRSSIDAGQTGSPQTRFITIVFDDVVTPSFGDLMRSVEAAGRFIREDIAPSDLVAIMTASGRYAGSFSGNRQEILEQLHAAASKFNYSRASTAQCPNLSDSEALKISRNQLDPVTFEEFVQHTIRCAGFDRLQSPPEQIRALAVRELKFQAIRQNEEYQSRTRSLLHSLRQYLRSLNHFEGSKFLIFLSGGFSSGDVRYEIQDVVTTALKSGVTMNAIDIRGLYTTIDPANEAGLRSPISELHVAKAAHRITDMSMQKEPLFQLANETGGTFVDSTNDLSSGLRQIITHSSANYVISYASPAAPADGKYHSIKVEVLRPGVKLDYRRGYYSPKQQASYVTRKSEDILDALSAPGDLNEIPVDFSYDSLRLEDGRFELSLVMKVQAESLPFLFEDERQQNLLHFLLAVFDENGKYVDGIEKALELKLTQPNYQSFKSHGFASKAEFKLAPGRYRIKAVVRESVQAKMGSLSKTIEIP